MEEKDEKKAMGEAMCVAIGLRLAVWSGWPDSLADLGKGDEREKEATFWFRLKEKGSC